MFSPLGMSLGRVEFMEFPNTAQLFIIEHDYAISFEDVPQKAIRIF
jgi:hypothetical protein